MTPPTRMRALRAHAFARCARWVSVAIALLALPAAAQEVADCEWQAIAANLVEPWEENSRVFSNGKTRLALLDTTEPAAGSFHLLVLSPPYGELGERQCRVVSYGGGVGFSWIDFAALEAVYDPSVGLMFGAPVRVFSGSTGEFHPAQLMFYLNQATGQIGALVE